MSRLTLQEEDVVFIPLVDTSFKQDIGASLMIMFTYPACALFSPLTLPIFGYLNSYQSIKIANDPANLLNAQIIEMALGVSIGDFLEACVTGEKIRLSNGNEIHGRGCLIAGAVWDEFKKPIVPGEDTYWSDRAPAVKSLEIAGCNLVANLRAEEESDLLDGEDVDDWLRRTRAARAKNKDIRHHLVYEHPDIPGVQFRSDKHSISALITSSVPPQGIYSIPESELERIYGYDVKSIHKSLISKGFSGFPKASIEALKSSLWQQDLVLSELDALAEADQQRANIDRATGKGESEFSLRQRTDMSYRLHGFSIIRCFEGFDIEIFNSYLAERENFFGLMSELMWFLEALSKANGHLTPMQVFHQYPDNALSFIVLSKLSQIAKDRVKGQHE